MWLDGFRCSKQCRCLKDDDEKEERNRPMISSVLFVPLLP